MKFKEYNQKQGIMKVIIPEELLDPRDPARIINKVFEKIDLRKIYSKYKEVGNTAYHPDMMMRVLFYSYYLGIHSCRKMWEALKKRADYIYLSGDQMPDFRTLNDFRTRHIEHIPDIFAQVVLLCESLGMVGFEHLAIDGQKIHANANFRKSYTPESILERHEKVKKGIEKLVQENLDSQHESNEKIERKLKKLRLEDSKLTSLAEVFKQKEEEKQTPVGAKEIRLNLTDIDALTMKHKDGTSKPSYNHQSGVDNKYGVTVTIATQNENDHGKHLYPIVDTAKTILGKIFNNVSADSGFCNYEVLKKAALERPENFYIVDQRQTNASMGMFRGKFDISRFEEDKDSKTMKCPVGNEMNLTTDTGEKRVYVGVGCSECSKKEQCTKGEKRTVTILSDMEYRDIMREKLATKDGREEYSKRQGTIESTHGDDQKNKGWRQHHLRGMAKASLEFYLIRIAANLGKMIRYRADEILAWA